MHKPATLALLLLTAASGAIAQTWPARPLRVIVPSQAGGAADVIARKIGSKFTETWHQPVVVDNRIGIVGAEITRAAPADGYTLMFSPDSLVIREAVYASLPYQTLRDFQPVTLAVLQPNVLVVHPSLPVSNVRELVALAKARPGQLTCGSAGNATAQHMAGELFKLVTKTDILHVPYKGVPQAITDLLGGRVQLAFGSPVSILPHVKEGRMKLLGVTTAQRQPSMPDVPTLAESGAPGYEFTGWLGMFVPKGTPRAVVDRLQAETARIVHSPEVKQLLNNGGTEPVGGTPEQFAASVKSELARYTKVAKEAGIKAD